MKFFREKNAKSIQNYKKITPKTDELPNLLIKKLLEKANHIEVICNENMRNDYLKRKNKLEKTKSMTEKEIKSILAKRLSVDLLQLYLDLLKAFNINENKNYKRVLFELEEREYKYKVIEVCELIKLNKYKEKHCNSLFQIILNYITLYNFNLSEIEIERKKVEEKEGSFYNGKLVMYEENNS